MLSTELHQPVGADALLFEPDVLECTVDEVCAVRLNGRVLILPITAELAAESGFEVVAVDESVLLSIGVQPTPPPPEPAASVHPVTNQAVFEQSVSGQPISVQPVFDQPVFDQPETGQAMTGQSVFDQPVTDPSATDPSVVAGSVAAGDGSVRRAAQDRGIDAELGLVGSLPPETGPGDGTVTVDRRASAAWHEATFDDVSQASSTDVARPLPSLETPDPVPTVPHVRTVLAPQAVDWSLVEAVVEPAKPLDVESATREGDGGPGMAGWPEIDRRSPEILSGAPAAFQPQNLSGAEVVYGQRKRAADALTVPGDPSAADAPVRSAPSGSSVSPAGPAQAMPGSNPTTVTGIPTSPGLQSVFATVVVSRLIVGTGGRHGADGADGAGARAVARADGSVSPAIDFVLAPGEVLEVRGGRPAVKALLETCAGYIAPLSGTVDVDGEERASLSDPERLRRRALSTGVVVADAVLVPEHTVATNLEVPLLAAGIAPATARLMVESRLETMGLTVLADRRVDSLTHDQRFIAGAARSLVMGTPLVVVDDPTHGVGDGAVGFLLGMLKQACDGGATLICASSDPRLRIPAMRVLDV